MQDYSRKIAERLWNQPDKGELESRREKTYMDDIIQKSHIDPVRIRQVFQDSLRTPEAVQSRLRRGLHNRFHQSLKGQLFIIYRDDIHENLLIRVRMFCPSFRS